MFHSLLALVPEGASRAETAEILARWLPTGFAGIGPYLPILRQTPRLCPNFGLQQPPQTITHRHKRSAPHTTNRTPTRTPRHKPNLSRTHSSHLSFTLCSIWRNMHCRKGKIPKRKSLWSPVHAPANISRLHRGYGALAAILPRGAYRQPPNCGRSGSLHHRLSTTAFSMWGWHLMSEAERGEGGHFHTPCVSSCGQSPQQVSIPLVRLTMLILPNAACPVGCATHGAVQNRDHCFKT
jgi:hypothetical protein